MNCNCILLLLSSKNISLFPDFLRKLFIDYSVKKFAYFCKTTRLDYITHCQFQHLYPTCIRPVVPPFTFTFPEFNMEKKCHFYYAVAKGRQVGIYESWSKCSAQVKDFLNPRFKKFATKSEAEEFISRNALKTPISDVKHASSNIFTTPTVNKRGWSVDSEEVINKRPKLETAKPKGGFVYAVARGTQVGIYSTWDECNAHVKGFKNAIFKKFASTLEAEEFISQNNASAAAHLGFSSNSAAVAVASKSATGAINQAVSNRQFSTSSTLDTRSGKVTKERIINKRLNQKIANASVDLSKFSVDQDGYVIVYTDGACKSNGKKGARAGIGIWFGDDHHLNVSEPVQGTKQTNNAAEIQAAMKAILQAKAFGINKLNVQTDSQFSINCVTQWMGKWKRNGWKLRNGTVVKNKEDLKLLDEAMNGMEIKWSYVAGHAGHYGNEAADRLAVLGSVK